MINIRPEKPEDRSAIYEVNRLAFGREVEPKLVDKLRESKNWIDGLSLVAEKDCEVVGHILFTQIPIGPYHEKFSTLILAPLAVKPDFQKQGVGSSLLMEGIKACESKGYKSIVVVGHADYYPRFGFSSAREKGLESSIPVPDEAFMVLELVPESLDAIEGLVIFPPEFDEPG